MKCITKTIDDAQYYGPNAINGLAGQLLRYGKYHNIQVEFTIKKTEFSEAILCKTPNWKKPKVISFCWLIGGYDQNGVRKVGVSTLYGGTEILFSFYLHELVELLHQLESTQELEMWKSQMEKSPAE